MLIGPIALSLATFLITSMPAFATMANAQQQQVRSEGGGLTASLNGASFTKGDTVTISGSVKETSIRSNVWINVADPAGKKVETFIVYINPGNKTFSQSFTAGESDSASLNELAYDLDGDYRVSLNYLTPASQLESVELIFEYHNSVATTTTTTPSTNSTAIPSAETSTSEINDTSSPAGAVGIAQSPSSPETSLAQEGRGSQTMNLEAPRQQYLSAWNNTAFSSRFNAFIEEGTPLGYGIYREHTPSNVFRPGETILLYLEPVGYGHKPIPASSSQDGSGDNDTTSTLYLTNITADYIISDPNGTELQSVTDVPVANSTSHRQNTEMFLALPLTQDQEQQSASSPVGDYIITYVINDQVSGQNFQLDKRITIADNTTANASNSTLPSNNNGSVQPPLPSQQQLLQEEPLSAVGQLDVEIDVEDNPIVMGNMQAITVIVSNATTDERIADANVEGTVSHATGLTRNFEGVTNSDGEYTFDLNIDENAPTGEFTISADASAAGYEEATETTTFEVITGSEAVEDGGEEEVEEDSVGVEEETPVEEGEESGSDNDEVDGEVLLCSTFNDLCSS